MGDRQPDRDHSKSHSVSGSEIWPRLEDGQELGVGWNQPKVASLCVHLKAEGAVKTIH